MQYYVLCGANGVMILKDTSFHYAQKVLNRYCKGARYVRKAASLKGAQQVVNSHVAAIAPWKEAPDNLPVGSFALIRNLRQNPDWHPYGMNSDSVN